MLKTSEAVIEDIEWIKDLLNKEVDLLSSLADEREWPSIRLMMFASSALERSKSQIKHLEGMLESYKNYIGVEDL